MELGRIVVVADNGMNTQENKYLIVNKRMDILYLKVSKELEKMRTWALDNNDYTEIKMHLEMLCLSINQELMR